MLSIVLNAVCCVIAWTFTFLTCRAEKRAEGARKRTRRIAEEMLSPQRSAGRPVAGTTTTPSVAPSSASLRAAITASASFITSPGLRFSRVHRFTKSVTVHDVSPLSRSDTRDFPTPMDCPTERTDSPLWAISRAMRATASASTSSITFLLPTALKCPSLRTCRQVEHLAMSVGADDDSGRPWRTCR